jgi:hypothetical protein
MSVAMFILFTEIVKLLGSICGGLNSDCLQGHRDTGYIGLIAPRLEYLLDRDRTSFVQTYVLIHARSANSIVAS